MLIGKQSRAAKQIGEQAAIDKNLWPGGKFRNFLLENILLRYKFEKPAQFEGTEQFGSVYFTVIFFF